jgi:ERCC4-related helicase
MLSSSSIFIGGRGGDNDFVNGDTQVLITTPQMAGEGKDYSFAESVVMYELPLSARRLIQCMSRTIKLGVTTVANVDVLIASPLEQNIFELLERKKLHIEEVELNESFK